MIILHRAYFPLYFADSIIFSRQLISKGIDAGGTADNITEHSLGIRGEATGPWIPTFPTSFSCVSFSSLLSDVGKLLNVQGLCELTCDGFMARGGSGCGRVPATKGDEISQYRY